MWEWCQRGCCSVWAEAPGVGKTALVVERFTGVGESLLGLLRETVRGALGLLVQFRESLGVTLQEGQSVLDRRLLEQGFYYPCGASICRLVRCQLA